MRFDLLILQPENGKHCECDDGTHNNAQPEPRLIQSQPHLNDIVGCIDPTDSGHREKSLPTSQNPIGAQKQCAQEQQDEKGGLQAVESHNMGGDQQSGQNEGQQPNKYQFLLKLNATDRKLRNSALQSLRCLPKQSAESMETASLKGARSDISAEFFAQSLVKCLRGNL